MKNGLLIIILSVLLPLANYGQKKTAPKNLKTAVKLLSKDCPNDLQEKIKVTNNDSLIFLIRPWGGDYNKISNWTNDSVPSPKIVKYFNNKGINIPKEQEIAILIAFKSYLLNGKFDEKAILLPFQIKEKKRKAEELIKYTADTLNSVYIPKNLEDSFLELNKIWKDSTSIKLEKLKKGMHFGFGMWLRNNWGLWGGSRFSNYFNDLGIYHADDMSGIILTSYARYLRKEDIKLEEQVEFSKNYWKEAKEKNEALEKEKFEKYKIGEIVFFKYPNGYISNEQEIKYDEDICIAKGQIIEKNEKYYSVKIQLLESCDKKGIIAYDNINSLVYNKNTEEYEKPKKRKIEKMKIGQVFWFNYSNWEINE
ncbi:hypothetical protein FLJC2902T_30690 [Flavobacterium limnosediminis JC2902]|uniref:DUF6794 domain-containing protein n=1 Tax=Flavobacterium limnosediminis JC2902 TaxID=1341181 RepID=V6SGR7_9FLAO|nr:DUF6794 domain-containing protein [Flavobacterium limnosediminis]ESU25639.1 hypothetical protein FLJC2902T_30690 [Flavobacterium limnosediminis JC2902]